MARISNKDFKDTLESILAGRPVYIVGTGVAVIVTNYYFNKNSRSGRRGLTRSKNVNECEIVFIGTPDKKAIDKTTYYSLSVENNNSRSGMATNVSSSNEIRINAKISIKELRALPFKTKAANLLYGQNNQGE